jgi:hypothetical protein
VQRAVSRRRLEEAARTDSVAKSAQVCKKRVVARASSTRIAGAGFARDRRRCSRCGEVCATRRPLSLSAASMGGIGKPTTAQGYKMPKP